MITRAIVSICLVQALAALATAQPLPVWSRHTDYYGKTELRSYTYNDQGWPLTVVQRDSTRTITNSGFVERGYLSTYGHPVVQRVNPTQRQIDSLDVNGNVVDTLELTKWEIVDKEIREIHRWRRDPSSGDLQPSYYLKNIYDDVAPIPVSYTEWYAGQDTLFHDTIAYTMSNGLIDTLWTRFDKEVYTYDQSGLMTRVIQYDRESGALRRMWDSIVLFESPRDYIHHEDLEYARPSLRDFNNYRRIRIRYWDKTKNDWVLENDLYYEYNTNSQPTYLHDIYFHIVFEYYPDGDLKRALTYRNVDDSLWAETRSIRQYDGDRVISDTLLFMSLNSFPDRTYYVDGVWEFGYEPLSVGSTQDGPRSSAIYPNPPSGIYPNPSSGFFSVASCSCGGPIDVTVLSSTGTEVEHVQLGAVGGDLDIRNLPNGVYLVRVNSCDATTLNKLTLQR